MDTYNTYLSIDTRNLQFEKKNAIHFFFSLASFITYERDHKN